MNSDIINFLLGAIYGTVLYLATHIGNRRKR